MVHDAPEPSDVNYHKFDFKKADILRARFFTLLVRTMCRMNTYTHTNIHTIFV